MRLRLPINHFYLSSHLFSSTSSARFNRRHRVMYRSGTADRESWAVSVNSILGCFPTLHRSLGILSIYRQQQISKSQYDLLNLAPFLLIYPHLPHAKCPRGNLGLSIRSSQKGGLGTALYFSIDQSRLSLSSSSSIPDSPTIISLYSQAVIVLPDLALQKARSPGALFETSTYLTSFPVALLFLL